MIIVSRQMPYPPNFSKIAAKIILPAIGASTCAFGSHRCIKNIGNLTRNPEMIKGNIIVGIVRLVEFINIMVDILLFIMNKKIINIGSDAVTVYIIIYILACKRSG